MRYYFDDNGVWKLNKKGLPMEREDALEFNREDIAKAKDPKYTQLIENKRRGVC